MSKWFEKIDCKNYNVIYSRIRLARSWDEYVFPSRRTATQCGEMVERLREGLKGIADRIPHPVRQIGPHDPVALGCQLLLGA